MKSKCFVRGGAGGVSCVVLNLSGGSVKCFFQSEVGVAVGSGGEGGGHDSGDGGGKVVVSRRPEWYGESLVVCWWCRKGKVNRCVV